MIIRQMPLYLTMIVLFCAYAILSISSCSNIERNESHKDVSLESIEKGKELAEKYCQSCHLLPDPSWVDTETWENTTLPNMAPWLGIFHHRNKTYPSSRFDMNSKDVYPSQPVLSEEQWQNIIDYFTASAPDTLIVYENRKHSINMELDLFSAVTPAFQYSVPSVSFLKIDTTSTHRRLIVSDATKQKTYFLNHQVKVTDSLQIEGAIVDIELGKNDWLVCNIGVLDPNNGTYGKVQKIISGDEILKKDSILFSNLARPVQIISADMNNDGRPDKIICEFGFLKGRLSLMLSEKNGEYKKVVLRALPGAIKAYVDDYNHDGLLDLWVLFSQGEEGIFLYTNKGNNEFDEKQVLRFPPIYGSSYFEFDDFNNDGKPDILYTCGDNADYSTILKPFHGVYIFLNKGNNQFEEEYFFPINGCYKAIAKDFDNDGDLDIAAISFFADYKNQPEEGFVYLENKGNYEFSPFSLPATQIGRWLTMDAGDFDGDGKTDLILGNFSRAPSFIESSIDWKKGPPFLLLKNKGIKKPQGVMLSD